MKNRHPHLRQCRLSRRRIGANPLTPYNFTGPRVTETAAPSRFAVATADGYTINGFVWRHPGPGRSTGPVAIINPATSVRCRYYARFAEYLFAHGFDVITYDYRGIGESRPASLRGFDAGWIDWGHFDFEAVLQHVHRSFPGQPIHVVAHSIGGLVLGLAPSSHLIDRVFTMGAQFAWRGDYAPGPRLRMIAKWHVAMPLLTLPFGYFPGRKLGWLEDTPKGVVRDWVRSRPRFEHTPRGRAAARYPSSQVLVQRFAAMTAPTLAVSVTDDAFGTVAAVERLLAYFTQSEKQHLRISPQSISTQSIGHFHFFHARFQDQLWHIPLQWLLNGHLPDRCPGTLVQPRS
jgi:predicted alpha/beta hydrolase